MSRLLLSRSQTPVLLVLVCATAASAASLRRRSGLIFDYGPAPPPDQGPPLSAGATRNPVIIPYEVAGIVGAYVLAVVLVGISLWIINRYRRKPIALYSTHKPEVELQDAQVFAEFYPTPVTPYKSTTNFSWPSQSPEKKSPAPYVFPSVSPHSRHGSSDLFDQRIVEADRSLRQQTLEDLYAHVMEFEEAKAAGVVLKTPVPPKMQRAAPPPAEAPQRQSHKSSERVSQLEVDVTRAEKTQSRTSSLFSSLKSPKKKGVRGLTISSPIPTPADYHPPTAPEPATPRYYSPPAPPPVPSGQSSLDPSPVSPLRSQFAGIRIDPGVTREPANHRHIPSYASSQSLRDPVSATSITSQTPLYPGPPRRDSNHSQSTYGGARPLPFRAFDPPVPSHSSQTTKTTVLERTSPLSPGLRTPWSAGAVPYSPYQPFTPVVPMTPTLVTREEMKRKKKEEAKKPTLELIKNDDELWDSGW